MQIIFSVYHFRVLVDSLGWYLTLFNREKFGLFYVSEFQHNKNCNMWCWRMFSLNATSLLYTCIYTLCLSPFKIAFSMRKGKLLFKGILWFLLQKKSSFCNQNHPVIMFCKLGCLHIWFNQTVWKDLLQCFL